MTDKQATIPRATSENIIAVLSLLGIGGYLVLRYALDIGHEVYTLSLNAALSSAVAEIYQGQFSCPIELVSVPLLVVLALGGIPLVYQLIVKLGQGDWGADLLAGMSIVTAVLLDEYLAGSLVVLMLSGGVVLETYAVRKASSVLEALAKRMPSVAHRKSGDQLADITTGQVHIGDTLLILPHEICPVDGTVLEGSGTMDESYLTGEPYMMSKVSGSQVTVRRDQRRFGADHTRGQAGCRFALCQDHGGDEVVRAVSAQHQAAGRSTGRAVHAAGRHHCTDCLGGQRRCGSFPGGTGHRHAVPVADRHSGHRDQLDFAGRAAGNYHQESGHTGNHRHLPHGHFR